MFYGLLNLSFWGYVVATLLMTHITIAAVTIFLHRHQAHRALTLHPIISHFFRFWLWITTGMVTAEWVAVHRKHHAKVEKPGDPHSPQLLGLHKVLFEGAELYREAAKDKETLEQFSYGTPDDWIENKLYRPRCVQGIVTMFIVDLLLFGVPGITVWAIQMMWIPIFAAGVINGVGHYFGYRNFECTDASTNILPWGILIGGEELHNNHHTYPASAKLSAKWWEFDIGWFYIRLFEFLKLAKVKKLPPEIQQDVGKATIDLDTVKAVIAYRFQVMAQYAKEVVTPVLKQEKVLSDEEQGASFRQAKKLLTRERSLLSEQAKERLSRLIGTRTNLRLVYQFRENLQAIWSQTTSNPVELLEALQTWCKQAEATGIEALGTFSKKIRTFIPKTEEVSA